MRKTDLVGGLKKYDINGYVNLIRCLVDVSWRLDDPDVCNDSRPIGEEEQWDGQDSGVETPPFHNKHHSGNESAAESTAAQPTAYRGAQSMRLPPTAAEVAAHPFFNQSRTPSTQSLAAPPQSLSGDSKTGKAPSQSAFGSAESRYPGRYEVDKNKLKEWKMSEITKIKNDKSNVGALEESEIASIRALYLA